MTTANSELAATANNDWALAGKPVMLTHRAPVAPMLSGDKAYELFTSAKAFPLVDFLSAWKAGEVPGAPRYVIAVINAYAGMVRNCADGRYGVIREN